MSHSRESAIARLPDLPKTNPRLQITKGCEAHRISLTKLLVSAESGRVVVGGNMCVCAICEKHYDEAFHAAQIVNATRGRFSP